MINGSSSTDSSEAMATRGFSVVHQFVRNRGELSSLVLKSHQKKPTTLINYQRNHHHVFCSPISTVDHEYKLALVHGHRAPLVTHSKRFLHPSVVHLQKDKPPDSTDATGVGSQSSLEDQYIEDDEPIIPTKDETGKPLSNWARMKFVMKTYGYVVIPVHWVIAPIWFGGFYYAIKLGIDIEPLLSKVGVSDHHIETLKNSKASTALMAYALYKIFTPLRYTVTLGATEFSIRSLRRRGYIKPTPPKEKTYRQSFKDTAGAVRDKLQKENKG